MIWILLGALLAAAPLDGRDRPVREDLLEQLAGSWKLTGTAAGRPERRDCGMGAGAPVPVDPVRDRPEGRARVASCIDPAQFFTFLRRRRLSPFRS